ncbi:hypothetical protein BJY04DRAFT_210210 [Aspergillus karnatakaensis]|uniref:glucosamine-6-phosphate deaminase n=1 Tax=Aspergillus karnatakaensis TaxID=1810916 RepID=UPI003CCD6326
MRLIIRSRPQDAAQYIADYIIDRITSFNPTPARPFVLGLPTGSSPLPIYKALINAYKQGRISFKNVVTFNMDEYVGLPREHPQSYHSFMWTNFFAHVDVDPRNVNILNGNAEDLQSECERYEEKIKKVGGIELFLGGVGTDGHIAFNEPGSSLGSRTRVKSLALETIIANARYFGGDTSLVPRMALTVGVQTIMDAKEVIIIATGSEKALAVKDGVEGSVSQMCTLSALQMHQHALIIVDEDATAELRVKTVKYFTGVEKTMLQREAAQVEVPTTPVTPRLDTSVSNVLWQDGELTPDSMSSRMGSPKTMGTKAATIPLELSKPTH